MTIRDLQGVIQDSIDYHLEHLTNFALPRQEIVQANKIAEIIITSIVEQDITKDMGIRVLRQFKNYSTNEDYQKTITKIINQLKGLEL